MATKKTPISSEAVQKATGKTWDEWLALLDAAGAKAMTHQQIVAVLRDRHGVGMWWQQMVTVGYEQARGRRVTHERPDGFSINRSKTIAAPLARAYAAWKEKRIRGKWLADADFTIRKSTLNKSLRITWTDGATQLDVQFFAKGRGKCQVTLKHARLKSEKEAEKMKAYWGKQLERLQALLED
ncbi:MAG: DUF4287 domain-containing protein [Planctomycetes bacterium]|nr:DUF4287 domain-containing protein [Planctomycetota bacterium]